MTITSQKSHATRPESSGRRPMIGALATTAAAALLAVGVVVGLVVARDDGRTAGDSPSPTTPASMRDYYDAMMDRSGWDDGMMSGGSRARLRGDRGFAWMMGGANAPGWMNGGSLPQTMMGSADPGQVMGQLFADAPGDRISAARAAALGEQVPPGAVVDVDANSVTFSGPTAEVAVLAASDHAFRVAGLTNPTISVRVGSRVTLTFVNADTDTAHGVVISATAPPYSSMPMMTTAPAFAGAAVWFLGDPTSHGMHESTITFTAGESGTYRYLCPVPGHARAGMVGVLLVTAQ